ncbi:MAG: hypothetical protein V4713_06645 [Pseudomonadota bacterium]
MSKQEQFAIALPCSQEDFGKFIGSLLGKPQTISNSLQGSFEIQKNDIVDSYHLVNQRVQQQNESHLIQFSVRLVYDDGSSVLLNSLEDLVAYTEVRPIVPVQAHLSWSFIVQFRDRQHPEKQEIDLSFISVLNGGMHFHQMSNGTLIEKKINGGLISFRIRHTARTWGADIEGLLTGHAKHLMLPEAPMRKFARQHSGKIAAAMAFIFFCSTVAICFFAAENIANEQLKLLAGLMKSPNAIDMKINRLLEMTAQGFWGKYFFSVFVFVIFSFVFAVILSIWAGSSADTHRPSYLLLTKKAEQYKTECDKSYRIKWFSFLGSLIISIATGIGSNILFTKYWTP